MVAIKMKRDALDWIECILSDGALWREAVRECGGFIYFIRAAEVGRVKIGYCRDHPAGRIRDLQVGSPVRLDGMGFLWGTQGLERAVHHHFASARVHGEWFALAPEVEAFAAEHLQPWPDTFGDGPPIREWDESKVRWVGRIARQLANAIASGRVVCDRCADCGEPIDLLVPSGHPES